MSNEINLSGATGWTVTAQLYQGTAAVGAAIALSEVSALGNYTGSVPSGTPPGDYVVVFLKGTEKVASGLLRWDGVQELIPAINDMTNTIFAFVA